MKQLIGYIVFAILLLALVWIFYAAMFKSAYNL